MVFEVEYIMFIYLGIVCLLDLVYGSEFKMCEGFFFVVFDGCENDVW